MVGGEKQNWSSIAVNAASQVAAEGLVQEIDFASDLQKFRKDGDMDLYKERLNATGDKRVALNQARVILEIQREKNLPRFGGGRMFADPAIIGGEFESTVPEVLEQGVGDSVGSMGGGGGSGIVGGMPIAMLAGVPLNLLVAVVPP